MQLPEWVVEFLVCQPFEKLVADKGYGNLPLTVESLGRTLRRVVALWCIPLPSAVFRDRL